MPEADVVLTAQLAEDLHPITSLQGEHTSLAILNCLYNQGTPDEIVQASAFTLVRYAAQADNGYDIEHFVRTEGGERVEVEWKPDDEEYGPCWRVLMPDEPITIETRATEKGTYAGKEFVGAYRGFEIGTEPRLISGDALPMNMTIEANTVFRVETDDAHAFAFGGCYVYDEATRQFAFERDKCKDTYAVSGLFFDERAIVQVEDVVYGISRPTYLYFAGKADYTYACACDEYAYRYLVEIASGTEKAYYYFERGYHYDIRRAEAVFDEGTTIAEPSSALVSVDGTPLLRYRLDAPGADPVFVKKGPEAGTYASDDGAGPSLTLDGFGNAVLGTATGTYTVENGIVDFTADDGSTAKYVIDTDALTYTVTQSVEAWDGEAHLYAESDYGYNSSVSKDWIKGEVWLDMDCDLAGNAKAGYAALKMYVPNDFFGKETVVSDCVPYVYDKAAGTLVLSQVAQGKGDGWGQVRRDVAFTVTERKTPVFTTEYIYSMGSPNRFIYVSGLELLPVAEP